MATDVSTSLPALHPDEGAIYTVTLDDPSAVITQLVIHGTQEGGIIAISGQALYLQQSDGNLGGGG